MSEPAKVYKVMRNEGGELRSMIAGRHLKNIKGATYQEGLVTFAPQDQQNLTCFNRLEDAVSFASSFDGHIVIHECIPCGGSTGPLFHSDINWQSSDSYPALVVGKEVWSPVPRESWKDITGECITKEMSPSPGKQLFLMHEGHIVAVVKEGGWRAIHDEFAKDNYKVEIDGCGYGGQWFRVYKKEYIVQQPPESCRLID